MNKKMRRAVALYLIHTWDSGVYVKVFKSFYDTGLTTPMGAAGDPAFLARARDKARELEALNPRVVE